ncbi:alanine aminotransferase 2-like [Amblyomma americanum]
MSTDELETTRNVGQRITGSNALKGISELMRWTEAELKEGKKLGFADLIRADISDGQAFGQKPLTFPRQVVCACAFPDIADHMPLPHDVVSRANEILHNCPGNTVGSVILGGHPTVRRHVADYISHRDSVEVNPENVWITNGVFHGVSLVLDALKRRSNGKPPGVLACLPLYTSYFSMLQDKGYYEAYYYLYEDRNWSHNVSWMQEALDESRKHCTPRFLFLVNPSNPPGTVLSKNEIEGVIRFAHKNKLTILADEVFEHNVYNNRRPFHTVRKILNAMGAPYRAMPLISFSSISKGFAAEGGLQSGYFEAINLDPVDEANLEHIMEEVLPPMLSQVALDCFVRPPDPGEPSHDVYFKEKAVILSSLAERAKLAEHRLNTIEGIQCSPVHATMAAYPRISIPQKAVEHALSQGKEPDVFYAEELLRQKGVCVTPGSAFGRLPGRYYIRVTILPPKDKLVELFDRLESFHEEFLAKYS